VDHIGIDVHKKESQICLLAEAGELVEQRIRTEPERFAAVLGGRPRARILIEASTDSEWVDSWSKTPFGPPRLNLRHTPSLPRRVEAPTRPLGREPP
jgi:hypothetical protein